MQKSKIIVTIMLFTLYAIANNQQIKEPNLEIIYTNKTQSITTAIKQLEEKQRQELTIINQCSEKIANLNTNGMQLEPLIREMQQATIRYQQYDKEIKKVKNIKRDKMNKNKIM